MVKIVTGKINQGKTTRLYQHFLNEGQGDGFLAIKHMDKDKVHHYDLLHLKTKTSMPFSIHETFYSEHEKIRYVIGPYLFYDKAFSYIEEQIKIIIKNKINPVYFDEVGMLEVQEKGYYKYIKQCLDNDLDVYMTIREDLVKKVLKVFSIQEYEVIDG